ncbi:MAG: hypothetical protein CVV64_04255 [Candidatus Wallbacteria bacterium HGW-Wallbacteria-1]|jgi:hypothetical protein|uniref:Uncharacterized protein n=1 Tax=Candidatus Wallbacteria bacterium HGW-Wallbacteria-1 TaxID=2013854 RepID=A0A2N1PRL9_9BACT|nr:MAG: hypothetical protein CVV64_04255 [Candidatus Wallbacteria bacterium HGW-Wallbacteria-1]
MASAGSELEGEADEDMDGDMYAEADVETVAEIDGEDEINTINVRQRTAGNIDFIMAIFRRSFMADLSLSD